VKPDVFKTWPGFKHQWSSDVLLKYIEIMSILCITLCNHVGTISSQKVFRPGASSTNSLFSRRFWYANWKASFVETARRQSPVHVFALLSLPTWYGKLWKCFQYCAATLHDT
jgi:hypothetical protein